MRSIKYTLKRVSASCKLIFSGAILLACLSKIECHNIELESSTEYKMSLNTDIESNPYNSKSHNTEIESNTEYKMNPITDIESNPY